MKKIFFYTIFLVITTLSIFILSGCAVNHKPKPIYSTKYYKSHIKKAKKTVFNCNEKLIGANAPNIVPDNLHWKKNLGNNFRHLADIYGTLLEPSSVYKNILGKYTFKNCMNALSVLYHKSQSIYKKQHPSMF